MTPEEKVAVFLLADSGTGAFIFIVAMGIGMWVLAIVAFAFAVVCLEFYAAWNRLVRPKAK